MGFELLDQGRLTVSIGYDLAFQVVNGIAAYNIVREVIIAFWVKIKSILVDETDDFISNLRPFLPQSRALGQLARL